MKVYNFEQYSDEWRDLHLGKITASKFKNIITPGKASSTQHKLYLEDLAAETVYRVKSASYQSRAMKHGTELEPEARALYTAFYAEGEVKEVGFCRHDACYNGLTFAFSGLIGCSPDGLVGEDGGLEIKCRERIGLHGRVQRKGEILSQDIPQVQGSLWITGRDYWDYMSYFPGTDPAIIRVYPDKDYFKRLDTLMLKAVEKLKRYIKELEEKKNG